MMKRTILTLATLSMMAMPAFAQKSILTGGVDGAYNKTFCPPIPNVIAGANFQGYKCTPSDGTLDNIAQVIAKPSNIGFAQFDVLAREMSTKPELEKQITVVRQLDACEGLWAVTKNASIKNFGDIVGARRTPFILPPQVSGSAASFAFLQSLDPDGLGRAKNIRYVGDAKAVINAVSTSTDNAVGFFVQWANPDNGNIQLMLEKGLNVVPVVSRELERAKVGDQSVYQVQSFNLTADGIISSGKASITSCTPVVIITGNPEAAKDRDAKDDQRDLINVIRGIPSSALLPSDSKLASLMKSIKKVSAAGLQEMYAAADKAKQAASSMGN